MKRRAASLKQWSVVHRMRAGSLRCSGQAAPGRPWERDTLVHTWSITKTMSALTMLVLADRGVVDLDAPVATYWPEFAAAGKDAVNAFHAAGLSAGGTDEGAPGPRGHLPNAYAAYLRDPAGNKVCAYTFE